MADQYRDKALRYHQFPRPGKIKIEVTKPVSTQHDLSLAYSPGVAHPCEAIAADPLAALDYTSKGNMVGVVTNGTAVLGLGDIGAQASKPVMEGKAALFKRFADINVFDIEIDEPDPVKLAETIERLGPTFGGINLEDIKAPDCFYVENYLREKMSIPVFHDDQHGTAIVVAAAMKSALEVVGKDISEVKMVTSGAGAAALSCIRLLVSMGLKKENLMVTDLYGVVYEGRPEEMDEYKAEFARDTQKRTLAEVIEGADVFLGLSAGNVMKAEMLQAMAEKPVVFALANPTPEIDPALAKEIRPEVVMATGRTDYPNQVNNVLCFPFLFRGALDVGAIEINEAMKLACVEAISNLAKKATSDIVARAYQGESLIFGADYLIPKPFDHRLILEIAPAVAQAAMDSGVAQRPIEDMTQYRHNLESFVYRSGMFMRPVMAEAKSLQRRVAFPEGENPKVLQAIDNIVMDQLCQPIVFGRRDVVQKIIDEYGLKLQIDADFELLEYEDNEEWITEYHLINERRGRTLQECRELLRSNGSIQAAMMVRMGEADTMICGTVGRFHRHLERILSASSQDDGYHALSALSVLLNSEYTLFVGDTHVTIDPTAEELARLAQQSVEVVEHFGMEPKVALLSHSNFGSRDSVHSRKMREVLGLLNEQAPDLMVEGEMQAALAFNIPERKRIMPNANIDGQANILIMPGIDAAHIGMNLLKATGDTLAVGPILLGCELDVQIVTQSTTVRGLINMAAIASVLCCNNR